MKKTLLLLVALITATIAFAQKVEINGIYYNLNDETQTAEVTDQSSGNWEGNYPEITTIIIPEKVTHNGTEYSVTSIRDWAISHCYSLSSITIPNSVTSIGSRAFYNCDALTSISIPNSVTSIGSSAFSSCSSLTSIDVDVNNPNYTSIDGVLYKKDITTLISCPGSKTSISIPNSVTSIEESAFSGCSSLTSITIPNSVTSIGNSAFWNCSSLTSITIPNSVTYIGSWAFAYCSSLTSISIPNSVTSIGDNAFEGCRSLTSITIPNSVTYIGDEAFYDCSSLTSITIPNSITYIGDYAFYNCSSLTSITIPNSITSIEDYAFSDCTSLTSITIPEGVTSIGKFAFSSCSSLTSVSIPNSVTYIGYCAFYECSSLTSITIPNSVISIDESAFEDCNKLRTVQIGKSIETIEGDAFAGCTAIYSITINAIIPPIIDATTFTGVSHTAQIKVPCNAVVAYQASNYWNKFTNYTETPYSLTVVSNDNTMGNAGVIKQPTCQDIIAQVQAQALPGYEFVKWSDGFTENPHTIYVTSDTTITAEFRKINEEPEDKHNIFIVESADKTQGDVTITITANAIKGFDFSHWSDGSTENPRIVTLDENIELYAYFKVAEATNLETSKISSANIYTTNGTLHIEGATGNYHILDAAGRLIYFGNASTLTLPRGIYLVTMGGEVEKIVL